MAIARAFVALFLAASLQPSFADRVAYFDAALAPTPGVTIDIPPDLRAKKPKDVADAAAAFDRGLVFIAQGAWKEAEKELHNAEKKTDNQSQEYIFAAAYSYLKLHRADDALKRYEKIYKKDPANTRAIVGMAAAYEDMQHYADAVRIWQRYARTPLPPRERAGAEHMLAGARELFAQYYEIAENPGGGAKNLMSPQEELSLGFGYAQQLEANGVPLVTDEVITGYVKELCQQLVAHAKGFPTNYEVYVLDTAVVNAQTTPGYIFVFRGILNVAKTEDELAGVLGHEIGHSVAHHVAKSVTKEKLDAQQAAQLKASTNKLSQFLGKMMESGNPLGQLSFSRENEAQADRLGVHIAYDAGFDPLGLVGMFRTFESISPSSRSNWDLMMRTHPFAIDRVNTITDYSALLPPRPARKSSPDYSKMKARLAALPPPPDATGLMKSGTGLPPKGPPQDTPSPQAGTQTFTIRETPLSGAIPSDWEARKTDTGTVVFEAKKGTEAYEVSVELEVLPKAALSGRTAADLAQAMFARLSQQRSAQIDAPLSRTTSRGIPGIAVMGTYTVQAQAQAAAFQHVAVILDYAEHVVILSYYGPQALFDKYVPIYQAIGESLRYNGK